MQQLLASKSFCRWLKNPFIFQGTANIISFSFAVSESENIWCYHSTYKAFIIMIFGAENKASSSCLIYNLIYRGMIILSKLLGAFSLIFLLTKYNLYSTPYHVCFCKIAPWIYNSTINKYNLKDPRVRDPSPQWSLQKQCTSDKNLNMQMSCSSRKHIGVFWITDGSEFQRLGSSILVLGVKSWLHGNQQQNFHWLSWSQAFISKYLEVVR